MASLALLGCGHIGKDILRGLLKNTRTSSKPLVSHFIAAVNRQASASRLEREFESDRDCIRVLCNNNVRAAKEADVVLLSFPPDQLRHVLGETGMDQAVRDKLVISILAGVKRDVIQDRLKQAHIIRIMPSLGIKISQSSSLLVEDEPPIPQDLKDKARGLFEAIGHINDTSANLFDAMTALAAMSHAMMNVTLDAIADVCAAEGVHREKSLSFAATCFLGYANLIAKAHDPLDLKQSLSTPRGITNNAILRLEKHGLRRCIIETFEQTTRYSRSLSQKQAGRETG